MLVRLLLRALYFSAVVHRPPVVLYPLPTMVLRHWNTTGFIVHELDSTGSIVHGQLDTLCELMVVSAGNAVWPQAAVECLTFHQMTDRCIPTFAGDLNRNLVLHWASDGRELHVGQDDGLLSVATMRRLLEEGKRLYDQRNPG